MHNHIGEEIPRAGPGITQNSQIRDSVFAGIRAVYFREQLSEPPGAPR
jgi:hypothetical protein